MTLCKRYDVWVHLQFACHVDGIVDVTWIDRRRRNRLQQLVRDQGRFQKGSGIVEGLADLVRKCTHVVE